MLKIKAALISLVLGSSSVALASPGVTFTANADASFSFGGPVQRDHRVPSSYGMPVRTSWVALSAPMTLRNGSAVVRPELARISSLRLQASRGMTYVYRVELRFRSGGTQTLQVNKWLTTASAIDLEIRNYRRNIDSIAVIGSASRFASHQLFANASRVEIPSPVYQPPVYQAPSPPVYQPPVYQPPVYRGFNLGQDMSFAGTDGRKFLNVGADKGSFSTLRLQGASGSAYIKMVRIEFTDGTEQMLSGVQKTLLGGQSLDIKLDGYSARGVERVTVWANDTGQAIDYSTGSFNATLL
jgi:hypothetical protein